MCVHLQMWIGFWIPFSLVGSCPNTKLDLLSPLHFCFIVVNYTKYKLLNYPSARILQWYLVHSAQAIIIAIYLQRMFHLVTEVVCPFNTNAPPSLLQPKKLPFYFLPLISGQC